MKLRPMCGRCFDEVDDLVPATCTEDPLPQGNLGMYHCPDCGAMLLGGFPHPPVCKPCRDLKHPRMDRADD